MRRCAACENPDAGYTHTCAGSGTFLAAEVHVKENIEELAAAWPYFNTRLAFRMRAYDEQMVREKLTPLVEALLSDDLVDSCDFTVEQDEL